MIGKQILSLFVFPGLVFTAVLGLLVGWLDRKVSARFQFRVGPPFFQNFNDLFKLWGKEIRAVRDGVRWLFIAAPLVTLGMITLASALVGGALFFRAERGGDLIVVLYLLLLAPLMVALGGASTGNVFASIGAGREIKLLLADELAFLLVALVPVIRAGYETRLSGILEHQAQHGPLIGSISGLIAFLVGIITIQAKMALPPFHIPEAETELVEGPFIEYGGPLLALWKLSRFMMAVVFPFLLILLFWGGFQARGLGPLWFALKYLLIVVLLIIIKNTNPRVRIDTALSFFWKWASPLALAAALLAVFGV